MGVFSAFFGCSGATGFSDCCLGVSSGDGGFTVTTSPCPARETVRPARLVGDTNGTKFALCVQNARNRVILGEQGEFYPGSGGVWLVRSSLLHIEWRLLSPGDGARNCAVPGIARSFARRCRWARPPTSRPRRELRSARRLEAHPCPPVPPTTSRRPHSVTCSWHCGVRAVDNEARASCRRIGKQPHAGSGPQAASHGRPPPTADPSRKV